MIHYKKKTCVRDVVDKVACDLCEKEYDGLNIEEEDPDDSQYAHFYKNMVEMVYKEGRNYSCYECWENEGQKISIEICPDCFKDVVMPFLESKGLKKKWEQFDLW